MLQLCYHTHLVAGKILYGIGYSLPWHPMGWDGINVLQPILDVGWDGVSHGILSSI